MNLTYSLTLTHSLTHSLLLTHSLTNSLTHSLTHLLLLAHSYSYSLAHSYLLTYLLTYSYVDGGKQFERIPLSPKLPGEPISIINLGNQKAEMITSQGAIYSTENG